MSDHKVTLTYTPGDQTSWSFDPKTTTLKHNGTVTLEQASGSNWTFFSVNGLPSSMSWQLQANNTKIVISDDIVENGGTATYTYTVTVKYGTNGSATSPATQGSTGDVGVPPVIQNDGGQDPKGGKK